MGKNSNKDEEYDDDFDMGEFRQKYIMFDRLFFEVSKADTSICSSHVSFLSDYRYKYINQFL